MHHGTFLYPITVYFLSTKNLLSPSFISKGKNQEHPHVLLQNMGMFLGKTPGCFQQQHPDVL